MGLWGRGKDLCLPRLELGPLFQESMLPAIRLAVLSLHGHENELMGRQRPRAAEPNGQNKNRVSCIPDQYSDINSGINRHLNRATLLHHPDSKSCMSVLNPISTPPCRVLAQTGLGAHPDVTSSSRTTQAQPPASARPLQNRRGRERRGPRSCLATACLVDAHCDHPKCRFEAWRGMLQKRSFFT